MKVLAKPGAKCPMEHKPRAYITDLVVVDVPDSTYYRRLLADGSLILADSAPVAEQGGHD
ncbi:MAG: hypothetical protein A4E68_01935 [Syntrophaceae bacterium PtaB.Bin095]|jgi:hypothetical protein|nr:MAG: hypothetical protein A4E68_01935 [Syntrophaceae bacterium PtaB.Bin095]